MTSLPLAVDLDGTLITTDALIEAAFSLIKTNPLNIFNLLIWRNQGKAYAKRQIVERTHTDPALLPYNLPFLQYLKEEHATGRKLYLVTASDHVIADKIATHLGLFDKVIASDGVTNMSSAQKAIVLSQLFGPKQFAYAGNAPTDLNVWKVAGEAIVIGPQSLIIKAAAVTTVTKTFPTSPTNLRTWLKAIRVHQWVKNTLLFVPLLAAHAITNFTALSATCVGFLSFSFMASAIYLFNDLMDLQSDRQHPSKKFRPLAAGTLHPIHALIGIIALVILSLSLASTLPALFGSLLITYIIVNLAYSWYFKQTVLLDVIILASLYALRMLAGSAAASIPTSSWLFVFAVFFFLSLALVKRVTELHDLTKGSGTKAHGRGYASGDEEVLTALGVSSGFISLLVLALYMSSSNVLTLYRTPTLLWLLIPVMMFWIGRVWLLAHRGAMHSDPIVFAIKDKTSYLVLAFTAVIVWFAT